MGVLKWIKMRDPQTWSHAPTSWLHGIVQTKILAQWKRPDFFAKGHVFLQPRILIVFFFFTKTCFLGEACNAPEVDFMEVKGTNIFRNPKVGDTWGPWGSSYFMGWFMSKMTWKNDPKATSLPWHFLYQTSFFKDTPPKNLWKKTSRSTTTYCWWLKSCTTWDVWNPRNNGRNFLSTGAGFQPSTVVTFVDFSWPQVTMLPEVANQMSSLLGPTMASWDCGASGAAEGTGGKHGVVFDRGTWRGV